MEVFQFNQEMLQRFGMCLDGERVTRVEQVVSKIVNWLMVWIAVLTILVSIEYIVSHFDDTESILFAVMQV